MCKSEKYCRMLMFSSSQIFSKLLIFSFPVFVSCFTGGGFRWTDGGCGSIETRRYDSSEEHTVR